MSEVVVLDYGGGNVQSVVSALSRVGATPHLSGDPQRVRTADRLVFPGQGALPDCISGLRARGLDEALREHLASGRPYLGICVGLQALFEWGEEHGGSEGLGLLAGRVVRFPRRATDASGRPLKVPHMGWNTVHLTDAGRAHPVLSAVPDATHFYFVHSYFADPTDDSVIAGRSEHGETFCAMVARDNLLATQFHPEKSQEAGEALLGAWLAHRA